jgi:hypothetical protein
MNDFVDLLLAHFSEINALIWTNLRARHVLSDKTHRLFPPWVKTGGAFDVPGGIIAHLTR